MRERDRSANELPYDAESALRLVDAALEDLRLTGALLERARTVHTAAPDDGARAAAFHRIGAPHLDGAAHLLTELELRLVRLGEMLRTRDSEFGIRD
jgi:hypothetical protein